MMLFGIVDDELGVVGQLVDRLVDGDGIGYLVDGHLGGAGGVWFWFLYGGLCMLGWFGWCSVQM